MFTGHGLGAVGFFTRLAVWLSDVAAPAWAEANGYFGANLGKGHPLDAWISWEFAGVAIGALVGSLTTRRFRVKIERGPRIGVSAAWDWPWPAACSPASARARAGLHQWARPVGWCNAAVAAFVFLIAFFAAGLLVSRLTWRLWQ